MKQIKNYIIAIIFSASFLIVVGILVLISLAVYNYLTVNFALKNLTELGQVNLIEGAKGPYDRNFVDEIFSKEIADNRFVSLIWYPELETMFVCLKSKTDYNNLKLINCLKASGKVRLDFDSVVNTNGRYGITPWLYWIVDDETTDKSVVEFAALFIHMDKQTYDSLLNFGYLRGYPLCAKCEFMDMPNSPLYVNGMLPMRIVRLGFLKSIFLARYFDIQESRRKESAEIVGALINEILKKKPTKKEFLDDFGESYRKVVLPMIQSE